MPPREPFAYALLRAVPRAERGESINLGVVLFCRTLGFLALKGAVGADRLRALHPDVDLDEVARQLRALELIAAGDPQGGPVAGSTPSERFHWLVSPSNTVVQPSQVHTGLCDDPAETLDRLFQSLVADPQP